MNSVHEENGSDAGIALEAIRETQAAAAARAKAPAWYHPALGGILGLMIGAMEAPGHLPIVAIATGGLSIAVWEAQRQTGIWMTGFSGGRRSYGFMALGALVIFGGLIVGLVLNYRLGVDGAMIVTGVGIGAFATWFGYALERRLLKDAEVRR